MTTEESPHSFISHTGDEKYIVVQIVDRNTQKKRLAIYSMPLRYHSMIFENVKRQLPENEKMTCLGGGILTIDDKKKTIFTYGSSGGFGPPEIEQVKHILQNSPECQGYEIKVTVTDYIRD